MCGILQVNNLGHERREKIQNELLVVRHMYFRTHCLLESLMHFSLLVLAEETEKRSEKDFKYFCSLFKS